VGGRGCSAAPTSGDFKLFRCNSGLFLGLVCLASKLYTLAAEAFGFSGAFISLDFYLLQRLTLLSFTSSALLENFTADAIMRF
jgi:hypothetical protein